VRHSLAPCAMTFHIFDPHLLSRLPHGIMHSSFLHECRLTPFKGRPSFRWEIHHTPQTQPQGNGYHHSYNRYVHVRYSAAHIKTSPLYRGFNVETVKYQNLTITVWDVGGATSSTHSRRIVSDKRVLTQRFFNRASFRLPKYEGNHLCRRLGRSKVYLRGKGGVTMDAQRCRAP
jgi:hypothetical protein